MRKPSLMLKLRQAWDVDEAFPPDRRARFFQVSTRGTRSAGHGRASAACLQGARHNLWLLDMCMEQGPAITAAGHPPRAAYDVLRRVSTRRSECFVGDSKLAQHVRRRHELLALLDPQVAVLY